MGRAWLTTVLLASCAAPNAHTHAPHTVSAVIVRGSRVPKIAVGKPCPGCDACASGECVGWCTTLCNVNVDCAAGMTCIGHTCSPVCLSDADCSIYGSWSKCQAQTSASGFPVVSCTQ